MIYSKVLIDLIKLLLNLKIHVKTKMFFSWILVVKNANLCHVFLLFLCKFDFYLRDMAIHNLKYLNMFLKEIFWLFLYFIFTKKNDLFNTRKALTCRLSSQILNKKEQNNDKHKNYCKYIP